jgi:uncharacterized membrane protein YdbT with pleckstrin-like domain
MSQQTQTQTLTYRCPHCGAALAVDPCAEGSVLSCPAPGCGKPFRIAVPVARPIEKPAGLALPGGVEAGLKGIPAPTCPPPANGPANAHTPAAAAPAPPAAPAGAPTVTTTPAPEVPEGEPQVIKLSMFRRYPFRCLGYLLLAAASVALMVYGEQKEWYWLAILGVLVLAISGGRFFVWWLRMVRTSLTLTNRRLILTTGVFARDSIEFELHRINDYHISQSLLMRLLDVGDLAIVSSERRVVVMAVPDPQAVVAFLQTNIATRKQEQETPDMVVVQQPVTTPSAATTSA